MKSAAQQNSSQVGKSDTNKTRATAVWNIQLEEEW
jgi:hypothetical protein